MELLPKSKSYFENGIVKIKRRVAVELKKKWENWL